MFFGKTCTNVKQFRKPFFDFIGDLHRCGQPNDPNAINFINHPSKQLEIGIIWSHSKQE